jgi:hypothetical protein
MNSLFKTRFLIAYYSDDNQYLDNDFVRTKTEAIETAKNHISDQFKRFGVKIIAWIYNELKFPNDPGLKISLS